MVSAGGVGGGIRRENALLARLILFQTDRMCLQLLQAQIMERPDRPMHHD